MFNLKKLRARQNRSKVKTTFSFRYYSTGVGHYKYASGNQTINQAYYKNVLVVVFELKIWGRKGLKQKMDSLPLLTDRRILASSPSRNFWHNFKYLCFLYPLFARSTSFQFLKIENYAEREVIWFNWRKTDKYWDCL